jgi:hypothetical protein
MLGYNSAIKLFGVVKVGLSRLSYGWLYGVIYGLYVGVIVAACA